MQKFQVKILCLILLIHIKSILRQNKQHKSFKENPDFPHVSPYQLFPCLASGKVEILISQLPYWPGLFISIIKMSWGSFIAFSGSQAKLGCLPITSCLLMVSAPEQA